MQNLPLIKTIRFVAFILIGLVAILVHSTPAAGQNAGNSAERLRLKRIRSLLPALAPLHQKLPPPRPGDWLETHPEKGQDFKDYVRSNPITLTAPRTVLYVLPLGDFSPRQREIVSLSAEFLGIYFSCKVVTLDPLSVHDWIPQAAKRVHPSWGVPQIKSTFVLETLLTPRVPADGVALICFTTSDLYPSDDWDFVFGQATYRDRVGVWSINRNGHPDSEFELCLKRTLRVATHETGHMFSMPHCIAYQCNMCGSNSLNDALRKRCGPLAVTRSLGLLHSATFASVTRCWTRPSITRRHSSSLSNVYPTARSKAIACPILDLRPLVKRKKYESDGI